jgi:hypothetical protein
MSELASPRAGAWAIVAGTIASVALMAAHPSSVGTLRIGPFDINVIVHAVAVLATPLLVFGAFALTKFIDRPLAGLALSFYVFACVAIMSAATMSGFVMTQLVNAAHTPSASRTGIDFQSLANLTHWQNQAYANVYTGLAAIAVLFWSMAWRGATVQRVLGLIVGGGTLAWMLTGTLTLNIHGMMAVTLGQAIWMLFAASRMMTAK